MNNRFSNTLIQVKDPSLSEIGKKEIDAAFYCWAVKVLNRNVNLGKAEIGFSQIYKCYDDQQRFFHRGLGHPRSLFPVASQKIYKEILLSNFLNQDLMNEIDNRMTKIFPAESDRIREAQEILAAYYHDIIHRNGKKPEVLAQYVTNNKGFFLIDPNVVPNTASLLDDTKSDLKVEELSCIIAEDALKLLNISDKFIIPILLAIISTIPFSEFSHPSNLRNRLVGAAEKRFIEFKLEEIDSAIMAALSVSNRDLGSYGEDSLDLFNQKSWAMMLERNSNLAEPLHTLSDEAETIFRFYNLHKKLYDEIKNGTRFIYHSLNPTDPVIRKLNDRAQKILELDILLQGLQLGSAVILMHLLYKTDKELLGKPVTAATEEGCIKSFLRSFKDILVMNNNVDDLPKEVIDVLQNHGKECSVNGNRIMRGSNNAAFALQLVNLIDPKTILEIADAYSMLGQINNTEDKLKNLSTVIEQTFKSLHAKMVETNISANPNSIRRTLSLNSLNSLLPKKEIPKPGRCLELFVDINYTIIITDAAKGLDKKTAICKLLAEQYSAVWDPSITHEKMTFRDFVKNHLCPHDEIGQIAQYKNLFEYLKEKNHLELLNEIKKDYQDIKKMLNQDGEIFPSFINLINNLEANKDKTPYTIILRTFGNDLAKVVTELERRTPLKFSSHGHFDQDGYLIIGEKTNKTVEEIRTIMTPFKHGAWQDNYPRWKINKFVAGGKLFPLDIDNKNVVSVFWDDNIKENDKKILSIKLPSGKEIIDHDRFQNQLIKLGHLVPIDTKDAIKDNNYFIKLKNFAYYWTNLTDSKELLVLVSNNTAASNSPSAVVEEQKTKNEDTAVAIKINRSASYPSLFKPASRGDSRYSDKITSDAKLEVRPSLH